MSQIPPTPQGPPPTPGNQANGDDPESTNYSLDEIMKTLRDGERKKEDEGEMVTRDDGSVARRVRKRRRRSEQKEKVTPEKERRSLVLKASIIAGACLILLMVAVFVIAIANSGSHTEKLEARADTWTGAEVELIGVKMMPGNFKANEANFKWDRSHYLESLALKAISGDVRIASFLGGKLGGQQLGGGEGDLVVSQPTMAGEGLEELEPVDFPFNFQRYFCNSLNVRFGATDELSVRRAETSLRHINGEGFRLTVGGGDLNLKGWNRFPIENALLMFSPGEVDLVSLRLEAAERKNLTMKSVLALSGKIPLERGAKAQLDITTDGFPSDVLMGEALGPFFKGMIRRFEMGVVNFEVGEPTLESIIIPFEGNFIDLQRFAFVSDVENLFGDAAKGAFFFDSDIEGIYRWTPQASGLEKFKVENDNFKLRGDIVVSSEGALRGKLRLLISLGLIKGNSELEYLPGLQKMGREGYAQVDITLGGTVSEPQDNFKQVTGIQLPTNQESLDESSFDDFFNELTSGD